MNRFIKIAVLIIFIFNSCTQTDGGTFFDTKVTIYLINETSDIVFSEEGCQRNILSKDTLTIKENIRSEYTERPSVDNYYPFSNEFCNFFYDVDRILCQKGLRDIENYENRKEITPLEFEFTFRFTEVKKAVAESCN